MSLRTLGEHGGGGGGFGGSSSDQLAERFYPLYERLFSEDSEFVQGLQKKLKQSRMSDTVEMYLSRALGIGVLSGLFLWILGMVIGWLLFIRIGVLGDEVLLLEGIDNQALVDFAKTVKIPALILFTGLFFGSIGFALGFGALVSVPYSRASARKREINMLLVDAVSFMYALSVGGLNQLEILEAMAQAEDTYGEVAREFQSIVHETEYFDTDYKTAIRNQALETPSDELAQFLTDMLSIVNSGGDMESFLDDKKQKHMRTAKQQQEMTLETLELFGEMYMTLSLFPLLLIIILVIMKMMGQANDDMLYGTVYGLIPLTGAGFMVLVSTVKQDEPGDGYLRPADRSEWLESHESRGLLDLGLVEQFTGEFSVFDRIESREGTYETVQVLSKPHIFFRDNPVYTLALTVPAALVVVAVALVSGQAPTMWDGVCQSAVDASNTVACSSSNAATNDAGEKIVETAGMIQQPVWGTFIYAYVPTYMILLPLAVFYEWNVHSRRAVISDISDNLRKLSSANDTGLTLLESIETVSETTSGKLAREFDAIHAKVNYGMSLKEALVEFNNKYHLPRLARTVKLIAKAQEASSQITDVLTTAAQASENQDDIDRERKSRTRMQVVIIIMTYLTLLAVMGILKTQFLDVMTGLVEQGGGGGGGAGGGATSFGGNINPGLLSLMFFHAVTLQAILSGFISGYMRDADILSGVKYVVVLMTIALAAWIVVA
ncbi:flagella assembly protein j [Halobacteriales archaeon QS_8_69_26]|nr:MAG: flagella assembly protein j [Halobacteriales archaeon QS_8_69_26]